MKKLLSSFLMTLIVFVAVNAQMTNTDLEMWSPKTSSFGYPPFIATETYTYDDPTGWSTSNQVTNHSAFGAASNVVLDSTHYSGVLSAKLTTIPFSMLTFSFNVPGILVNGNFVLDPTAVTGGVDPIALPGTGMPATGDPGVFSGYFKYFPATGVDSDTCTIMAVGVDASRNQICQAVFQSSAVTATFTRFEVPFEYLACGTVDTVIILALSSPVNFTAGSGLPGSTLYVDSFTVLDATAPVNVHPEAVDDAASTIQETAVDIDVLANDSDCESDAMMPNIVVSPANGTAMVTGTNTITYTPNPSYTGTDVFTYTACDAGGCGMEATVSVTVNPSGIELRNNDFNVYPNPVINVVYVDNKTNMNGHIEMIDILGNIAVRNDMKFGKNELSTSNLSKGVYLLNVLDNNGTIVSSRRIVKE